MTSLSPASKDRPRETLEPDKGKNGALKPEAPPALPLDLATFSDANLSNLVTEAEQELARRRAQREADALASILSQVQALNLDPAKVVAALGKRSGPRPRSGSDARSTVTPKYRNPENPSQTWAGRGQTPKWIELDPVTKQPLPRFVIPTAA
jgi:DNA-binding protein H-NS